MTDAHSTMTRGTSVSRKSTVASRNASLIKKNTGPHELRPSDILIERFTGKYHRSRKPAIRPTEGRLDRWTGQKDAGDNEKLTV